MILCTHQRVKRDGRLATIQDLTLDAPLSSLRVLAPGLRSLRRLSIQARGTAADAADAVPPNLLYYLAGLKTLVRLQPSLEGGNDRDVSHLTSAEPLSALCGLTQLVLKGVPGSCAATVPKLPRLRRLCINSLLPCHHAGLAAAPSVG